MKEKKKKINYTYNVKGQLTFDRVEHDVYSIERDLKRRLSKKDVEKIKEYYKKAEDGSFIFGRHEKKEVGEFIEDKLLAKIHEEYYWDEFKDRDIARYYIGNKVLRVMYNGELRECDKEKTDRIDKEREQLEERKEQERKRINETPVEELVSQLQHAMNKSDKKEVKIAIKELGIKYMCLDNEEDLMIEHPLSWDNWGGVGIDKYTTKQAIFGALAYLKKH